MERICLPMQETREMRVQTLGWEDPLEKEMAAHPIILPWEIPRTEEPSTLQSAELQRIGHNLPTEHKFVIAFLPRRKNLLISWLQSQSTVILELKKIKHVTATTFPP